MIFGGQIKGEAMRLFLVYSAGNFIEATRETCFFQVGESKYGKPILDRVLTPATSWTKPPSARWCRWTARSSPTSAWACRWTCWSTAMKACSDEHVCIDEHNPYFR
jgi:putative proteasome-type protease